MSQRIRLTSIVAGAVLALGPMSSTPTAAKKSAVGKAKKAPIAEPATKSKPAGAVLAIGAPASGAGRLVVLHLAAGLIDQAVDVYSKAPAAGFTFDRIGEHVSYGGAAAGDRAPGGVTALSLPTGAKIPNMPGMFSGPSLAPGGVVHVAVVGGAREGGYLHGHIAAVSGDVPEGSSRIGWSEVRGREGKFEVCADAGTGSSRWFLYEVKQSTWPVSEALTGKGWEKSRIVAPGKATIELREGGGPECAGKLLGQAVVEIGKGAVKLIHYGAEAGAGHLLFCPQGPPFDCVRRSL